jgi:hypothetical protein
LKLLLLVASDLASLPFDMTRARSSTRCAGRPIARRMSRRAMSAKGGPLETNAPDGACAIHRPRACAKLSREPGTIFRASSAGSTRSRRSPRWCAPTRRRRRSARMRAGMPGQQLRRWGLVATLSLSSHSSLRGVGTRSRGKCLRSVTGSNTRLDAVAAGRQPEVILSGLRPFLQKRSHSGCSQTGHAAAAGR